MPANYIETISAFFPTRQVEATGAGYDYDELVACDGQPLPSKEVLDPLRLKLAQEHMWKKIQAERDRRKYNGVRVDGNWFHTDDSSRIQQVGMVIMGAALPAISWKTLGNNFVTMTPTLAMKIFQAVAAQDVAIFTRAEQHKFAMYASPSPSAYDFSGGWPPTFGE